MTRRCRSARWTTRTAAAACVLLCGLVLAGPVLPSPLGQQSLVAASRVGQPESDAQSEFVPIDQLPPEDELPAAPLLIAAYGFLWMALVAYLWSIWRRLARVERELADLARRSDRAGTS